MEIYEFGDAAADSVLIQPVDARELAGMERESAAIRRKTGLAFRLAAVPVADWSRDLSPWRAEAVFRGEAFGRSFFALGSLLHGPLFRRGGRLAFGVVPRLRGLSAG